jgi:predicted ATPase
MMRLHALNGDRAATLRVYHNCVRVLEQELGVEPSLATRQAYERLLNVEEQVQAPPLQISASPMVGRSDEWSKLHTTWNRASQVRPGFALIAGEAGIGKSRLVEELLGWASQQGISSAIAHCYPAEGKLAYAPVAEWLRSRTFQRTIQSLEDEWLTEIARLMPEIMAERPDLARPDLLAEAWQRQRFFASLTQVVLRASQPLLLVIEDLHWCDEDTLEWLH